MPSPTITAGTRATAALLSAMESGATTYTQKTVVNTVTNTVLGSYTIAANTAVAGAIYRLHAWGIFSTTGTPTGRFETYLGGTGGTLLAQTPVITMGAAGKSGVPWQIWCDLTCLTTGSTGTWAPSMYFPDVFSNTGTTHPISGVTAVLDGFSSDTRDTTISNTFDLAFVWGTAASGNTLTCQGLVGERVA